MQRVLCLCLVVVSCLSSGAGQQSPATSSNTGANADPTITGGGAKDYLALWLNKTKLGKSSLFQSAKGNVGIGTTTPATTLDVNGTVNATTGFDLGGNAFVFGSYATFNAFLGFAGNTTMTGTGNTAAGFQALRFDTAGQANTASGAQALYANTTGNNNTADGLQALLSNTTGANNTATGYAALYSNSVGTDNTASGYGALAFNTTGDFNTATGVNALFANTIGALNTAFGEEALYSNSSAVQNTAGGYRALYSNTTGEENAAVGSQALYSNTTGRFNTGVGASALYNNMTGSNLTCIGWDCSPAVDGLFNATAIGAHAVVGESNARVLGGTGKYAVKVGIGTTKPSSVLTIARGAGHPVSDSWETYSSRRWKTNIETLPNALATVGRLRGVSYDQKDSGKHEIGVIAEEVGAVVPEVVSYEEGGKDATGVDYSRLTALLIEAVKQQQKQIAIQQGQIRRLRSRDALLESKLTQLQGHVDELRQVKRSDSKVAQTGGTVVAKAQF